MTGDKGSGIAALLLCAAELPAKQAQVAGARHAFSPAARLRISVK